MKSVKDDFVLEPYISISICNRMGPRAIKD